MIDLLQMAARAGGEVLLKYFKREFTTSFKGSHHNIVTQADTESQKIIHKTIVDEMLKRGFKKEDIGFIAEEGMNIKGRHKFIIDPLDGTTNFSVGLTNFCIPIAYLKDDVILDSVVFMPYNDVFYTASRGKGAYKLALKGNKNLKLIPGNLKEGVVSSNLSSNPEAREKLLPALSALYPQIRALRFLGVAAYEHCLLAENTLAASILPNTFIWDIAATKLIIEEAGGKIVNFEGQPIRLNLEKPETAYQTIAAHPNNLPELLKVFK